MVRIIYKKCNYLYLISIKMFGAFYNDGQKVLDKEDGLGQLWISGYDFAHNVDKLSSKGILAVCSGVNLNFKYPANFETLVFDLNDSSAQKASHVFKPSFEFIEEQRKKTNVLVHCAAGISRCSLITIGYMMQKYRWPFQKCLDKVKAARNCCQPNSGFTNQLRQLEQQLGIK